MAENDPIQGDAVCGGGVREDLCSFYEKVLDGFRGAEAFGLERWGDCGVCGGPGGLGEALGLRVLRFDV